MIKRTFGKMACILLTLALIIPLLPQDVRADRRSELAGVHPRVFFTQTDFNKLQGKIRYEFAALWTVIKTAGDSYAVDLPPAYYVDGVENLWISRYGKQLSTLCFIYKISGEAKYFTAAQQYVKTMSAYPAWATNQERKNNELAAEGAFIGFSLYYDWLYWELTADQKTLVLNQLSSRGEDMKIGGWWKYAYLQNHLMHGFGALTVTAAAIYDAYPDANDWFVKTQQVFAKTTDLYPFDGAGYEGSMYWGNGLTALLPALELLNIYGDSTLKNAEVYKKTADFALYNALPRNNWDKAKTRFYFGDSVPYEGYEQAGFLSLLAKNNQNPVTQWYVNQLIDEIVKQNYKHPLLWYILAFYDSNLAPISPDQDLDYPPDKQFEDTDYVFLRDGWSMGKTAMGFRLGPILGEDAAAYMEKNIYHLGAGHQHPDAGSPQLFFNGEWLLGDDGYVTGSTGQHNALLVGGLGQYGDEASFAALNIDRQTMLKDWHLVRPEIVNYVAKEDYVYVAGDVTKAYPLGASLSQYIRHFIYLKKEQILLITDQVKTSSHKEMEIRFKPFPQIAEEKNGGYLMRGARSQFMIKPFLRDGAMSEAVLLPQYADKSGKTKNGLTIRTQKSGQEWIQPFALSWAEQGKSLAEVNLMEEQNGILTFGIQGKKIKLDTLNKVIEIIPRYTVEVNEENGVFTVSGSVEHTMEAPVSLRVKAPSGAVAYVNELIADQKGHYEKSFRISPIEYGEFEVSIAHVSYGETVDTIVNLQQRVELPPPMLNLNYLKKTLQVNGKLSGYEGIPFSLFVKDEEGTLLWQEEGMTDTIGNYEREISISSLSNGEYRVEIHLKEINKVASAQIISQVPDGIFLTSGLTKTFPQENKVHYQVEIRNYHQEQKEVVLMISVVEKIGEIEQLLKLETIKDPLAPGEYTILQGEIEAALDVNKKIRVFLWEKDLTPINISQE